MKRDPRGLADRVWDVLVIGGGIHGACVAWDAVLRGLTVCLVEKGDFAGATSANTMKIVHGGLRYLQHGDYRRMRESIGERRTLLRIAPHLVRPLPVLVPAYGHGRRGRTVLRAALVLNDLIGLDRNTGLGDGQRLPRGRTVSSHECRRLAPALDADGLTGAGIFHDAQVYNSERLVLAFLRSAAKAGAELANYVEVTGLRPDRDRLMRIVAEDRLAGEACTLRARAVVNASGPWSSHVLGLARPGAQPRTSYVRALNVVTRRLFPAHAVALPMGPGARDRRLLFVVPWRRQSLVGTWYEPHPDGGGEARVTEADVARLLAEVNRACPPLGLTLDDVRLVHGGLLPGAEPGDETGTPRLARHGSIVDHARDGVPGLISVVGVKYTTARLMAERAVDRVFARLGRRPPPSFSATVPLHGADGVAVTATSARAPGTAEALAPLVMNHGAACGEVLADLSPGEDAADAVAVIRAQVRHAIRVEMAQSLADVVFRRTELGTAGDPGPGPLGIAARAAADELGWSPARERAELRQVYERFGVPR